MIAYVSVNYMKLNQPGASATESLAESMSLFQEAFFFDRDRIKFCKFCNSIINTDINGLCWLKFLC